MKDWLHASKQNEISEHQQRIKVRSEWVEAFLNTLFAQDKLITDFDEILCHTLVEKVTVYSVEYIRVTFKDGTVITL